MLLSTAKGKRAIQVHRGPHLYFSPEQQRTQMFPSAYVVTNHLGGAESRQNEGNPALGSGLPAARLPFCPGAAWPGGRGSGTWSFLRCRNLQLTLPFWAELGPTDEISESRFKYWPNSSFACPAET